MMHLLLPFQAPAAFNSAGVVAPRSAAVRAPAATMAFIDSLEGTGEETGGEIWDPLGISNAVSDEAMMWFRAAELKHGRAAMLGSVGYLIGAAGITFPGEIAKGVSFASVNSDGTPRAAARPGGWACMPSRLVLVLAAGVYNAWSKVPEEGKLQIICLLLALETANESKKPHYMRGGVPGRIDSLPFDRAAGTSGLWAPKIKFWDPLGFTGALSAEQKARKRKAELKNGCATCVVVRAVRMGLPAGPRFAVLLATRP
jgi:hypothetical protein